CIRRKISLFDLNKMNEQLLKAITRLFAIVAKERVTEEEKKKFIEFLSDHVNMDDIEDYLEIFDEFSHLERSPRAEEDLDAETLDPSTEEFIEDWANIVLICRHI